MTKPDFRILLRELLQSAIPADDPEDVWETLWNMTITTERMVEFEDMGLWDLEKSGWND
tara:strand:+ start:580 stop:756 length:177 start_codon:yes stop_codon:yes gene_type:complete